MTENQNTDNCLKSHDPEFDELLDPAAAAKFLGGSKPLNVGTLAVWRCTKKYNIPYLKIGRDVRYRKSELRKWRDRLCQNPNR